MTMAWMTRVSGSEAQGASVVAVVRRVGAAAWRLVSVAVERVAGRFRLQATGTAMVRATGIVVLLTGCERVVALDVSEGPVRLVVQGRLERVRGRVSGEQAIQLSLTAPYFSGQATPPARGAVVTVTDEFGRVTPFVESATAGTYVTNQLVVVLGRRYTLGITYEGQRYESQEVAVPVAPIESLYFDVPKPGRFSGTGGVRATLDLEDPAGVENFYLWDQFIDGVRVLGPDTTFKYRVTAPDRTFDGLLVEGFQPYEGIDIPAGSEVVMRQVGLSEPMYRYYVALSEQVSSDGSPFAVPPGSVRGNVANRTDASRHPLGYFHVAQVAEARLRRTR